MYDRQHEIDWLKECLQQEIDIGNMFRVKADRAFGSGALVGILFGLCFSLAIFLIFGNS